MNSIVYYAHLQPMPEVKKIILAEKLPNSIKDIPDDILNWAIQCKLTKKPFKIIPAELQFYRKFSLPVPRLHPFGRHLARMKKRPSRKLFARACEKCQKKIQTTFSPSRPEMVYGEACYLEMVY